MEEKKEKQYVSDNARLMEEWDWEKNEELGFDPQNLTSGSNKKVWWKCSKGHEWQAIISNRTKHNSDCPYCAGQRVIKGYNDLQTINPDVAKEWNYEKNDNLKPENFTANSSKKVWWKCNNGHEWQASICNRNKERGCPYCSNKKVLFGYNDLQTVNPALAKEWNCEKNGNLKPENFTANSHKKVWWKCSKGHEWESTIAHRNNGRGCPVCNSGQKTSFPEYILLYYLKESGFDVIHSYRENGYELDIYIPSKKIAIEYDGCYWHENKIKEDLEKNCKCEKEGIKLYRVREGLSPLNSSSIDYLVQKGQKNLCVIFRELLKEITGTSIDIDLKRDSIAIENLRYHNEKENSFLLSRPEISKEWNYEKNGNINPENFEANSRKKVWWKCSKGHEWQATIASRNIGRGCPYCSGRNAIINKNDLKTVNPLLAREWNYERNDGLKPEDFTANSGKNVWWKCSKGHEWQSRISNRNHGNGCPYCSGRKVLKGYNDLQTVNPALAKEWNYKRNGDLKPENFTANSNNKVWWICDNGHEWQTTIGSRNGGCSCPFCSGLYVIKGENDLQTINPMLAMEWNYEKNKGLFPTDVMPNSTKKVWWKCSKGHEWQATISNRNHGNGCPECAKEKRKNKERA